MSYATYEVHQWNAVLRGKSIQPEIALYIKPNPLFNDLVLMYNGRIPMKLKQTGLGGYDNKLCYAQVQSSSLTGGYRPNFQIVSGLVCLVPELNWEGYPGANGTVHILYEPDQLEGYREVHQRRNVMHQPRRPRVYTRSVSHSLTAIVFIILLSVILSKLIYE